MVAGSVCGRSGATTRQPSAKRSMIRPYERWALSVPPPCKRTSVCSGNGGHRLVEVGLGQFADVAGPQHTVAVDEERPRDPLAHAVGAGDRSARIIECGPVAADRVVEG